jgi:deazaflavin-dependent oxidoreductase (nitroreductase family)
MSRPDPLDQQVIAEFRARGGVVGATSDLSVLLLHNIGAKSRTERVTPLAYWPVSADSVAVLASSRGAATHPHWYHNLIANPMTTVEIGPEHAPREIPVVILDLLEKTRAATDQRARRAAVGEPAQQPPVALGAVGE